MKTEDNLNSVVGAFYLHANGNLIFKPIQAFATDEKYFESPFVKHVWLILTQPPYPTKKGQILWLLKDFLQEAHKKGALASEITRIVTATQMAPQFKDILEKFKPEEIVNAIITDTLEDFMKGIPDEK